ncbi:hypothetical protein G8S55_03745 [Clostridium botulinum C]|uniref:hypothetical protein n=1 Tax=Clostridium botulinum TaxID=1491 RepID=UPI001E3E6A37|nr:hypothetical protein [Clostridium botulinum C]MCD3245035.1 hypothetical protein [Clostridium botulinum C]MCD3261406.1 hypothetical protein [Clostridium botulinum C]
MTEIEKAYIAGIIDGEGGIILTKFHNNQFPAPCVSISSTTLELLEWIKSEANMDTIKSKKNYNIEKHKDSYSYTIKYNDAIEFLKYIKPYLIINVKKERAKLIINEYKSVTPRNGRYTNEMLEAKNNFYEKFIRIR